MKMENEKILLSGSPIEIADFKEYKLATFMICVCDELDLNGRIIPKESAEMYHSTIVGFPIVAKLICDTSGDPVDFAGHEMYIVTDEDGNETVRFGTLAIGSVVESWIEDREVEGYNGEKSCIMIKAKLWSSRYPEYFKVLDKLWAANNVKSSWEIAVSEAIQTTRGKILKAFSFIGNALLGSSVIGAVPGAGVYEYAQLHEADNDPEFELASALSKDVAISNNSERKEGDIAMENERTPIENTQENQTVIENVEEAEAVVNEISEADVVETTADEVAEPAGNGDEEHIELEQAALTDWDIREKIEKAHRAQTNLWGWVNWLFPAESEAWIQDDSCNDDTEIIVVKYIVNGDDLTIESETRSKLAAAPKSINEAVATRDDAIVKATEKINQLSAEIAELTPYKKAAAKAEQERIEAEIAAKRENFKARMLKTKLFDADEIESSEVLQSYIRDLDEAGMKAEIAERFMKSLDSEEVVSQKTETAEVHPENVRRIVADNDSEVDNDTFMRHLLDT